MTGLPDWAQTEDKSLPIDEMVIQTYQGKSIVLGYTAYLPAVM